MDIEFGKKREALKPGLLFFLTNNCWRSVCVVGAYGRSESGDLEAIRQMELKRTIEQNPGAQDPDTGVS